MCSTSLKVTINSFIYNIVRDRRANASEYGDDLLTLFLQDATKRGEELSDEYLRNIILNFMVSEPRKTLRARGHSVSCSYRNFSELTACAGGAFALQGRRT